jgi:hypothetical protein
VTITSSSQNNQGSPLTDIEGSSGVIIIDRTPTPQEEAEGTFDDHEKQHKHLKNRSNKDLGVFYNFCDSNTVHCKNVWQWSS